MMLWQQRQIRPAWRLALLAFSSLLAVRHQYLHFEVNSIHPLARNADVEAFYMALSKDVHLSDPPASLCSAKTIVQNAYERAYRPFVDRCQPGKPYIGCIVNATDDSFPWWLERLLRDSKHPFRRGYHEFFFDDPKLRFCRIEKVSSSRWNIISDKYYRTKVNGAAGGLRRWGWRSDTDTADAPHVVFFRDPLERFLSGYIDKCVKLSNDGEHCQPISAELRGIRSGYNKRHAFASYIHTFPLDWNVHFVPQALFCDGLFRTVQNYSFVGSMQDDQFVEDLSRLMDTYPGKLMDFVRKEFNFSPNATNFREELAKRQRNLETRLNQSLNVHHTGSTQKLLEYYDADAVRQVLEYYAIDYVTLKLEIPQWIQEVLDSDCHQRFRARSAIIGTGL